MPAYQTIVVVDDDTSMNQAIKRLLGAAGWHVLTFPSAEALLESGAASGAAAFVLDIRLPGLSGLELSERLAQEGIHAPVVFITAHDQPSGAVDTLRDRAVRVLKKPFLGRELIDILAKNISAQMS